MFALGIFILVISTVLILIIVEPNEMSEFSPSAFPELNEVAVTTLHLNNELESYIGNSVDGYSREDFYGEISIAYDGDVEAYQVVMRKRGATSFNFDKPQFSVSFVDDDQLQIEEKLMDMPKGEDWILNGPFVDQSMMRNYIAYKAASEIMTYAPRVQYTALYVQVNDQEPEYLGLYLWGEKIRRDNDRVDINQTLANQDTTSFIVEKNNYSEGDHIFSVYGKELYMYAYVISDVYPKLSLSDEQADYIGDVITTFERNLYHDKYDIPGKGYDELIDVNSFIDYYIINEFFLNTDAGHKSTFLYKDIRGSLHIGPVWDFNNAMGNVNTVFETQSYKGLFMHDRVWFDKLVQDPFFAVQVVNRYKVLRQGSLSTEKIIEDIDEAYDLIKPYAEEDHQIYDYEQVRQAMLIFLEGSDQALFDKVMSQDATGFDEEVDQLKEFVTNRGMWLDEYMESILKWTE